jgi:hypothetical protein
MGTLLRASADFRIQVADFFYASGSMGLEKSTRDLVLADGTEIRVDTLMIGGEDLHAFAGIRGPYWQDSNGNGVIDAGDEPEADSLGLALGDVDFGLVLASAAPSQEEIAGLSWTTVKARAGSIEFVGVPDVTLAARDLAVDINLVHGVDAAFDADTKVIDYTAEDGALEVITGTGRSMAMDAPGARGQLVRASGEIELSLGGFVEVRGSLAVERSSQQVTLTDGTKSASAPTAPTPTATGCWLARNSTPTPAAWACATSSSAWRSSTARARMRTRAGRRPPRWWAASTCCSACPRTCA